MPGAVAALFIIMIGKLVFTIWSIVIYLQALAEVQQFSIIRAIVNVILASLLVGIAVAMVFAIGLYVFHFASGPAVAIDFQQVKWVVQQMNFAP